VDPIFARLTEESQRRTLVMGVLNVTPDSFSDGGRYAKPQNAVQRIRQMVAEGADLVDVGAESTRPGAEPVSASEELARIRPVAEALQESFPGLAWSIDTQKAKVAALALDRGACLVNDVSALGADPSMARLVADRGCGAILMHRLTASADSDWSTRESHDYGPKGVVAGVLGFFRERTAWAEKQGVQRSQIWADPGFGFGKKVGDNLSLLKHLSTLIECGYPLVVGASRKSTLGAVLDNLPVEERLEGTAASVALCAWAGAACVRVHDVKEMVRVVRTVQAVKGAG
jgi:dihydropteroate synthase